MLKLTLQFRKEQGIIGKQENKLLSLINELTVIIKSVNIDL